MAYYDTRKLNLSEFSDDQIVAQIDNLDGKYNGTIRNIVWSCYEGSDDSSDPIETFHTTLDNEITTTANVFSGLTPGTVYYITAVISNIQGIDGEILYWGTQSTAESGGGEYPDPNYKIPNIEYFEAWQVGKEKRIDYKFRVHNLNLNSWGGVTVRCVPRGTPVDDNEWWTSSSSTIKGSDQFIVDDFGTYTLTLTAINGFEDRDDAVATSICIVDVVDDTPKCILNCDFKNISHSYDNGRVTGMIYNYPIILASDFTQFQKDINKVRDKAGFGSWSFTSVQPNSPMTANVFKELYDAIEDTRPIGIIDFPTKPKDKNNEITKEYLIEFITTLETTLKNCWDYYLSTS